MDGFNLSDLTNRHEFIKKLNGKNETTSQYPYVLTTDGTRAYWQIPSGGGGGGGGTIITFREYDYA